jgi:translation initiation factor IF-2
MGVRLNKVLTELNIGLQTAIDYLKNKPSLGEIKDDANVNSKISDEQYNALVREFKGDKDVKTQAGMIFPKKKDKPKKEVKPEPVVEVREESRQTFTPLGKIDLDAIGRPAKKEEKPKQEPVVAPQPQEAPVEVKEEKPVEAKPEPEPEQKPEPQVESQEEEKADFDQEEEEQDNTGNTEEKEIYTLKSEEKMAPKVNVLGKIDLDSLNQSTRPKKKSKEERRKEREEKQAQLHGGNGEKKKRERIRGGK